MRNDGTADSYLMQRLLADWKSINAGKTYSIDIN